MKAYAFELNSDTGPYFVRVYASNWRSAIETVCKWQNCPKRAIVAKWIVKTKELTFKKFLVSVRRRNHDI